MLKIALVLVKNVLLGLSELLHWIVKKPSALEPLEKS